MDAIDSAVNWDVTIVFLPAGLVCGPFFQWYRKSCARARRVAGAIRQSHQDSTIRVASAGGVTRRKSQADLATSIEVYRSRGGVTFGFFG
jgi:hypothetical protein